MQLAKLFKKNVFGRLALLLIIVLSVFAAWNGKSTPEEPREIYANIRMSENNGHFDVVKTEYFDTLEEANKTRNPGIFVTYTDSVYLEKENTTINMFVTTGVLNDEHTLKGCRETDDGSLMIDDEILITVSARTLCDGEYSSESATNDGICVGIRQNGTKSHVYAEKGMIEGISRSKTAAKDLVTAEAAL